MEDINTALAALIAAVAAEATDGMPRTYAAGDYHFTVSAAGEIVKIERR